MTIIQYFRHLLLFFSSRKWKRRKIPIELYARSTYYNGISHNSEFVDLIVSIIGWYSNSSVHGTGRRRFVRSKYFSFSKMARGSFFQSCYSIVMYFVVTISGSPSFIDLSAYIQSFPKRLKRNITYLPVQDR